jgi:hypothetical protein
MSYEYKPYKDSGSLRASATKKTEKSPDYWGDIAIDLNNTTNVRVIDGLTVFRVNGWKKQDKSGKTFLSLSVDRFVPQSRSEPAPQKSQAPDDDSDIPF